MKTLMLKDNEAPVDGYFISDPQYNKSFRQQALTPERLFELVCYYQEIGFDAVGLWKERGNTYVDALRYVVEPSKGWCVYDIKAEKHYTY